MNEFMVDFFQNRYKYDGFNYKTNRRWCITSFLELLLSVTMVTVFHNKILSYRKLINKFFNYCI